ncbi:hypothetical protein Plhal304r1_c008g0033831 [Plasmopara halstedii]
MFRQLAEAKKVVLLLNVIFFSRALDQYMYAHIDIVAFAPLTNNKFTDIYQRVGLSKAGRSGLLSTMASFFVSALWHVSWTVTRLLPLFLSGGIYIEVGKHLRRRLRSYFHYTEVRTAHPHAIFLSYFDGNSHPMAFLYDISGVFFTWVAMQYAGIAFEILDVRRCLAIWSSWHFLPHVVSVSLLLYFNLFPQRYNINKNQKTN